MSILVVNRVIRDGFGFILNRVIPNKGEILEIMQNSDTKPLELEMDDILVDRREDEDMDSTPHPHRVKLVKGELCEGIPIKRDFSKKGARLPEGYEDLPEEQQRKMEDEFFTKNLDNRFLIKKASGYKLVKDNFDEKRSGTVVVGEYISAKLLEENDIMDKQMLAMDKIQSGEEITMEELERVEFSPKFRKRIRRKHPEISEEVPRYVETAVELMKMIDEDGKHMPKGNKDGSALQSAARDPRKLKNYTYVELYHAVKEREDHGEGRHTIAENIADFSLMNACLEACGYEKQILSDEGKFDWPSEIAARIRKLNKHNAKGKTYQRTKGGQQADLETQDMRLAQLELALEETEDRTQRQIIRDQISMEKYGEIQTDYAPNKKRVIDFKESPDGNFITNQMKVSYICLKEGEIERDDMKTRKGLAEMFEMTFSQDGRIHLFPRKDIYMGGIRWDVDEAWLKTYSKYANAVKLTPEEEDMIDEMEGKAKHAINNEYSDNSDFDNDGCRVAKTVHIDSKS